MDELLVKLKTKYPDLTLSRVHLGYIKKVELIVIEWLILLTSL